jgi:sugar/nucleoside kinase (ribokinase family)
LKKILCIGSVTTDVIVTPADDVPPAGTLRAVDSVTTHVGGCASNAAVALARLGAPVALCCKVGRDLFGDFVCSEVSKNGVDIAGVVRGDIPTTTSVVCVRSDGERSFLYQPGSTSQFTAEDVPTTLLEECDLVFVAGAMLLSSFDGAPCAALLRRARAMGKFTAMDTAWDFEGRWLAKVEECLPQLDLFMPSYEEACRLAGETELEAIADRFLRMGARRIVIKNGKHGAFVKEGGGEPYQMATYAQYRPVDTTGAGDSFCAGLLCGLAAGWELRRSVAFANAVGTHCVLQVGASTGIPSKEAVLQFMKENEVSEA